LSSKDKKGVITTDLSALLRIVTENGEEALKQVLEARGERKGSSIIIPGNVLLPVLSEAAKWRWERKW